MSQFDREEQGVGRGEPTSPEAFQSILGDPLKIQSFIHPSAEGAEGEVRSAEPVSFTAEQLVSFLRGDPTDRHSRQHIQETLKQSAPQLLLGRRRPVSGYLLKAAIVLLTLVGVGTLTGAGVYYRLKDRLENFERTARELELNRPLIVKGGQAFEVAGFDRLKVALEFNRAYFKSVRLRWRNEPGTPWEVLYKGPDQAYEASGWERIERVSPPIRGGDRFVYITPTLEVEPYEELSSNDVMKRFFTTGTFERTFLVTPFGITADPPRRFPVGKLEKMVCDQDSENPNRYTVFGQVYPQTEGPPKFAYLVVESPSSSQCWVATRLALSPDGTFVSRCFLGPMKLDRKLYVAYLITGARADTRELTEGEEYPSNVDWSKLGYRKARDEGRKLKKNDGTDGFWKP